MAIPAARPTVTRVEPKSQHVADSSLQAFLQNDFDPANFLNSTLPPLSAPRSTGSQHSGAVPLAELSSQLQTLLSQLNAQTSRLSNTLTQLTDEIVRSGGRLAYEVEVLRGETACLTDTLHHGLKKDIEVLVGTGAANTSAPAGSNSVGSIDTARGDAPIEGVAAVNDPACDTSREPEYLERLRTLSVVRARLDSVIKVFGEAMQWPIAPSEVASVTSSLISVTAPDQSEENRSREEKGGEFAERLRNDINDLVGSGNDIPSLEAAAVRVEELRELAEIWKGTAEEKARMRLVESLQKPIEERQKVLEKNMGSRKPGVSPSRGVDYRYGNLDAQAEGGYGFLQNLRNLKNEMYLE